MTPEPSRYRHQVEEAFAWIRSQSAHRPLVGILTGTGLGESVDSMQIQAEFGYEQIPHFPLSTVQSHAGRLLLGEVSGVPMVVMQGRFHLYEGYSPGEVVFPIRVMQMLGVKFLMMSNAAGGLNPAFKPGDIMLIADHINLTGANPLVGRNEDDWGVRFPDMGFAYDPALIRKAESLAGSLDIRLQRGVYAGLRGPSLETPAEIRFLRTIGADAVGFSTVQEVIAAVHGRMKVLGLSIVTNAHNPDAPEPADVDDIIAVANQTAPTLGRLIDAVIASLN